MKNEARHCDTVKEALEDPAAVCSLSLRSGKPPTGADYLEMPNLERLLFTSVRPHDLPDEVRRLKRLRVLHLGRCRALPEVVGALRGLEELMVLGAPIPPGLKLPKLERLWLGGRALPGFTTLGRSCPRASAG